MALKPGDTLFNGQYRILRQLGRGGFGFVYEAQDTLLVEQVAVKELIPALVNEARVPEGFPLINLGAWNDDPIVIEAIKEKIDSKRGEPLESQ
jgi:serine/threonine protein kinase